MDEADRLLALRRRQANDDTQRAKAEGIQRNISAIRSSGQYLKSGLPDVITALVNAGYPCLVELTWTKPPGFVSQIWSLGTQVRKAGWIIASAKVEGRPYEWNTVHLYALPDGRVSQKGQAPMAVDDFVRRVEEEFLEGEAGATHWGRRVDTLQLLLEDVVREIQQFKQTGQLSN